MKTAEEIKRELCYLPDGRFKGTQSINIAMESYADQFKPKWISISEELPQKGQQVQVFGKRVSELNSEAEVYTIGNVYWDQPNYSMVSDFCYYDMWYVKITHWMPLIEPLNT